MSSAQRAWIVAASVGIVEALKDQGVCRWNHTLKSAQHVIKSHVGSLSQAKNLSFSSSMVSTSSRLKGKQSEESLRQWRIQEFNEGWALIKCILIRLLDSKFKGRHRTCSFLMYVADGSASANMMTRFKI